MRKLFWEVKTVVAIYVQKLEPVILSIAMITISEFIQSLTENLSISLAAVDERKYYRVRSILLSSTHPTLSKLFVMFTETV